MNVNLWMYQEIMETKLPLVVFLLNFINTGLSMDVSPALMKQYCGIKCERNGKVFPHTVCQFKCKLAPDCFQYKDHEMTNKERQFVLDVHNYLRNRVASGKDTRGGNGKAKDMSVLNYDKDMEIPARCWSRRCKFGHDICRHTPKYNNAGQNIHESASTAPIKYSPISFVNGSVRGWYNEIDHTTKQIIQKFESTGKKIGHFTQVVWASTKAIGCVIAFRTIKNNAYKYRVFLVCNYSPAGNFLGAPVYKFGSGCTGNDKPTKGFPALCGKLKIVSKDRMPFPSSARRIILDALVLICALMFYIVG